MGWSVSMCPVFDRLPRLQNGDYVCTCASMCVSVRVCICVWEKEKKKEKKVGRIEVRRYETVTERDETDIDKQNSKKENF